GLSIGLLTRPGDWTKTQRQMMRQATRAHGLWMGALLVCLVLMGWGAVEWYGTLRASSLVAKLAAAETADVPKIIDELAPYRRWTDPLLRTLLVRADASSKERLHASLGLLRVDPGQGDYLYGRLLTAQPDAL